MQPYSLGEGRGCAAFYGSCNTQNPKPDIRQVVGRYRATSSFVCKKDVCSGLCALLRSELVSFLVYVVSIVCHPHTSIGLKINDFFSQKLNVAMKVVQQTTRATYTFSQLRFCETTSH